MSVKPSGSMDASQLTRTEAEILDVLQENRDVDGEPWGIATKGYLVEKTGRSRNSVYNSLRALRGEHVEFIHEETRLVKFVSDPRDG